MSFSNPDDATLRTLFDRVQTIAVVGQNNPSFLHFEVRRGMEAVDPATYIN